MTLYHYINILQVHKSLIHLNRLCVTMNVFLCSESQMYRLKSSSTEKMNTCFLDIECMKHILAFVCSQYFIFIQIQSLLTQSPSLSDGNNGIVNRIKGFVCVRRETNSDIATNDKDCQQQPNTHNLQGTPHSHPYQPQDNNSFEIAQPHRRGMRKQALGSADTQTQCSNSI